MADITLKLVWFKLGEKYTDICEKYYHFLDWYEDFAWSRVDFLDMLFLGWLLAAFVVVGAINLYLRFFGHPKQSTKSESRGGISPQDGETAQWLNCLLSWLQKHYQNTPEFVEAWIRALNEQTRKHTGDYQIKVDKVQERSPAPKITRISTESSTQDYITLKVDVEAQETVLLVSAIQQSSTSVRVTNCDVAVQQLKGQLKVHLQLNTDEIQINICFATTPELKLQVRPKQIDSQVNIKTVEDVVQNALCSSVTSLVIPTKGGYPQYLGGIKPGSFMQERTQRQSSQTPSSSLQDEVANDSIIKAETMQTLATKNEPIKSDITKYESLKREQITHGDVHVRSYIGNTFEPANFPSATKPVPNGAHRVVRERTFSPKGQIYTSERISSKWGQDVVRQKTGNRIDSAQQGVIMRQNGSKPKPRAQSLQWAPVKETAINGFDEPVQFNVPKRSASLTKVADDGASGMRTSASVTLPNIKNYSFESGSSSTETLRSSHATSTSSGSGLSAILRKLRTLKVETGSNLSSTLPNPKSGSLENGTSLSAILRNPKTNGVENEPEQSNAFSTGRSYVPRPSSGFERGQGSSKPKEEVYVEKKVQKTTASTEQVAMRKHDKNTLRGERTQSLQSLPVTPGGSQGSAVTKSKTSKKQPKRSLSLSKGVGGTTGRSGESTPSEITADEISLQMMPVLTGSPKRIGKKKSNAGKERISTESMWAKAYGEESGPKDGEGLGTQLAAETQLFGKPKKMNEEKPKPDSTKDEKKKKLKDKKKRREKEDGKNSDDARVSDFMTSPVIDVPSPKFGMRNVDAASPSGSLQNRRLLVKVIKANGLGDKEFACTGPYCTVQLDEPRQKNTTSVVKNTVNPFWDEHFIFDLSDESTEIKFEVFDREKPPGIDFLGRAVIAMGELKRMPSSRQIIPLTGKPGATTTSGSVTVEFMFMEVESQKTTVAKQPEAENVSPRRRIETNRTVMPGGTVVTTKTTVTEKPRDHKMDFGYTESPSKVEKSETSSNYTGDYSPYSSRASSHLGAHEAGLTASQELTNGTTDSLTEHVLKSLSREREMREANRQSRASSKSSVTTVTITGVQQLREPVIPIIKTPDQRSLNGSSMDQPLPSPSDNKAEVKKSKSFADTLKRKFKRKPKSSRSQSVDRASSMKEHDLLRPPDQSSRCSESDYESEQIPEAGLQKNRSRSRSFSSSLKRLFKGKKKEPKEGRPSSRESSVSRQSARSATGALTVSREGTSNPQSQSCRDDFPYSTSVPAQTSPLFDQYNSH